MPEWTPAQLMPCGSEPAYQRHVRKGEPRDEACRLAHNRYCAERRASRSTGHRERRAEAERQRQAHEAAVAILIERHAIEFSRLKLAQMIKVARSMNT